MGAFSMGKRMKNHQYPNGKTAKRAHQGLTPKFIKIPNGKKNCWGQPKFIRVLRWVG